MRLELTLLDSGDVLVKADSGVTLAARQQVVESTKHLFEKYGARRACWEICRESGLADCLWVAA